MRALVIFIGFLLAGCAAQQTATAEQYICADPEIRAAKGGQDKCLAFYAAYRKNEDPCAKLETTLECVSMLRGLESAGFRPRV